MVYEAFVRIYGSSVNEKKNALLSLTNVSAFLGVSLSETLKIFYLKASDG